MAWSDKNLAFLRKHYPFKDNDWIASKLKKTAKAVKSKASVLKLKKKIKKHVVATSEIKKQVRKLYPNTINAEIGKKLKIKESLVSAIGFKLGLRKTKKFKLFHASKSAFQPGHVSANKGKKEVDYMDKEAIKRTAKTRFKKGHLPVNTLSNGVITIRHNHKERMARAYKWIRIKKAKWKMLHVHIWEQKRGKVPAGSIVIFKDGDTMNCEISNLKMITRQEHAANTRNKDGFIAKTLSQNGRGKYDKQLRDELLKYPDLLDAKRLQLNLNQKIKKELYASKE